MVKSSKQSSRKTGDRLHDMLDTGGSLEMGPTPNPPPSDEKNQLIDTLRTLIARTEARFETPGERSARHAVAIEDVVDGVYEETPHGPIFVVSTAMPLTAWRGSIGSILDGIHREVPPLLARLGGVEPLSGQRLSTLAYFDTETTGLATTSGTYAFMTGLGYVDGSSFRVDQIFMRDYDEELGYLWLLGERFRRFGGIVSYNGRAFDVPLIEARFITNRVFEPPIPRDHLDLLSSARRLWRMRGAGCRLTELEREVLGYERESDVPGYLIPGIYFEAVRSGNAAPLGAVFYHNREDVVSLACLTVAAASLLGGDAIPESATGEDFYSVARVLDECGDERTESVYRHAVEAEFRSPLAREEALCRLGLYLRRSGNRSAALDVFRNVAAQGTVFRAFGLIELAKHLEHQERAFEEAMAAAAEALDCSADVLIPGLRVPAELQPTTFEIEHRLARLAARRDGRPWRIEQTRGTPDSTTDSTEAPS